MPKRLSVVVPTFNRKDTLKLTLLSLSEQTSNDFEVVVADDGSADGTAEMLKSFKVPFPVKHVWQQNAGRSAARNMGIESAEGRIVLFVDDHMIADKRLIEEHIRSHDKLAGTPFLVVRGRVGFCNTTEEAPGETKYAEEGKFRAPANEQDPFRQFITNNISVDKQALISVGGFDEDFKEYGLQDSECGFRLRKAGYKFKINPNAVLTIFGVGLTIEDRKRRRRQLGRSSVLFYKKHPSFMIKMTLSVHWVPRSIYRILSLGGAFIPNLAENILKKRPSALAQKLVVFYSFLSGLEDGFNKYKDVGHLKLKSRFRRKKKILLLSHNARLEGAPISLLNLAKNLPKEKFDVLFLIPGPGPIKAMLDEAGLRTIILNGIFRRAKLRRTIIGEGVDLVHVNTLAAGWAIAPAKEAGAKVVWHIREDISYMKGISFGELSKKADVIIAISNWVKKSLPGIAGKVKVVYNAVDLKDFSPNISGEKVRAQFGVGRDDVLVGQIGAISRRKGSDVFVQAASKVSKEAKHIKFLMIGDFIPGEFFKKQFEKVLDSSGMKGHIIFVPPKKDIRDIFAALDIVVCSSRSEPFGRTIIEAMAMEKPVIATDVGGIPEIIIDGTTGIIVKHDDIEKLADEILYLSGDKNRMEDLGKAGRVRALEVFGIDRHVIEIEKIYEEVLR